jgi:hypothetical protein
LLGADIDVFCRRLINNYIFNGNEEDEDDDIGGPLVRNKSDWIPKPTKDKYLEESINTLKSNSLKNDSGSFFQCMLFRFDEPRSAVSYVSG